MVLTTVFFSLIWLTLTPSTATAAAGIADAINITKPGCQRQCGNVAIPYPFGIGDGSTCSMPHMTFKIECKTSFNSQKPYLSGGKVEVVNITDNQVRIKSSMASRSYDQNGMFIEQNSHLAWLKLGSTYFTISDVNAFMVIGCDDYAWFRWRNYSAGCMAMCFNKTAVPGDNNCFGIGCCQMSMPNGIRTYNTSLRSFNNHSKISMSVRVQKKFVRSTAEILQGVMNAIARMVSMV